MNLNFKLLLYLALVLSGNCYSAIVYPKAPDGGKQIVIKYAGGILRTAPRFLGGFRIEELTIANPYRNYYVNPRDLASGHFLSAARPAGWTYLFIHGTNEVGSEQLIADEKNGNALRFNGLYQADDLTLAALRIAEQLPPVKKQDYEVRRLDCPSILFRAVWLHGESGDIIIPLPDTFGRWKAYQPYSEKQMLTLLKPEAKKKLREAPGLED